MSTDTRREWMGHLERLARPVLEAAAAGELRARMPVEAHPAAVLREEVTHLEAVGRLLAGIAPWLELEDVPEEEVELQSELRSLARESVASIVDPASPDRANFTRHHQPLVDAAFLAHALLRSPQQLVRSLPTGVRQHLVDALVSTRTITAFFSNWLLFPAMVEVALGRLDREPDAVRIDYALRQHEQWYAGDGAYSDGPELRRDAYNSFVIQPMLLDVAESSPEVLAWFGPDHLEHLLRRAQRETSVIERSISPEGTFPVVGRSLAYRTGVLHLPAQLALAARLPPRLDPGALRAAMTALMRRCLDAPGTFDEGGWLRIGLAGAQPGIGETYVSTGSLYLAALVLLPLGLPADASFWRAPERPWTAARAWSGEDVPADEALPGRRRV